MSKVFILCTLYLILTAFLPGYSFGQSEEYTYPQIEINREYQFRHLTSEDGLPTNFIYEVMKDSRGFIWIATRSSGLCRYDGYNIKVYQNDPSDSTSISDNHIGSECKNRLVEDNDGNLWIATLNGLNKFNPVTETFKRYLHNPEDPGSISKSFIICLHIDRLGTLWVGTGEMGGLNKYNEDTDNFTVYKHNPGDTTLQIQTVLSIHEDLSGVFWVGTYNSLYQFDRDLETFEQIDIAPTLLAASDPMIFKVIYEDSRGKLFFGTRNGFLNIDTIKNKLIPFKPFYDVSFNLLTLDMQEDPLYWDQSLWITAWNLYKFDKNPLKLSHIIHDPKDPSSIRGNSLYSIYSDESGMLWVTGEFGINIMDPVMNQIKANPWFGEKYGDAMSFLEDSKGHIWIGTSKLLVHFDNEMNVVEQYDSFPLEKEGRVFSGHIWSICEDMDRNIWVGTETDGLFLREYGKNEFERCTFTGTMPDIPVFIWRIYEDSQGVIWVATFPYGLYQKKRGEYPPTRFYNDSLKKVFKNANINAIYEDRSGNLWLTTKLTGLYLQPPEYRGTYKFINYRYDPTDNQSLCSGWIYAIYEDESNNIWIATDNGLNKYIRENHTFERYINEIDLSANVIYNLTGDTRGWLWMTTDNGLIRFKPGGNDDPNKAKVAFKQILSFDDILPYTLYKNREGWIFLGGAYKSGKGYYSFQPDSLKENKRIPPVLVTDFKVRNEPYKLDTGITHKRHINLKHNQNFFSFEFSALDYSEPQKNQFAYMLEGTEDDWIYIGNQRLANYTNIPPGNYLFRVKGSNNDGYWNEEGASIKITILSPPWKTWWAYSIYGMFLIGLIIAWRRYDLKRQRLKQKLEIEQVESEKLKELDSLKSRFFANISHEFRTPLTLILGPIQKLFSKTSDEETKQELNIMQRNARRLQKLINQLLDLSKLESGKMKLQTSEENVVILIKSYVQQFESMAKQKNIDLVFRVAVAAAAAETAGETKDLEIPVYVDRDKIEKILFNLLSNAFKFTPEGGRIEVQVDKTSQVTYHISHITSLLISISDTGSGIPPEKLPHIFDRFYQADDSYTKDQEGTGIGLALTKELVEMHHGKIEVESKVDVGTSFRVYLPLGRNHLKPDQIDSSRQSAVDSRQSGVGFGDEEFGDEKIGNGMKIEEPGTWNLEPGTDSNEPLILIVEDNADLRIYIRGYLDPIYRIIEAKDGNQGLEQAIEHIPDLIISDVMMPKMDGLELCDKLKTDERTSHIPIILLTARAGMESKIEGLETGADDFITKPFDPEELMVRIRNLIEQRKKLQAKFLKKIRKLGLEQMLELENDELTSMDQRLLQKVTTYIIKNLSETDLSVESLGNHTALSTRQLHRKIIALTGDTPNKLIRSIRLHRAAELLRSKTGNVTEIAYEVGFNNLSWFAKCFKKEFGVLPSDFADKKII